MPQGVPSAPVRTCVGCRGRDEQPALLRVVAVPDRHDGSTERWLVVPDARRRGQGRGAYVHPDPACLQSAIARRAFGRALRLPAGAGADVSAVQEWLDQR
ncbi:YlxR family protein [Ornithinimicrobium cerasi]|uniref:YlxR domain-containing protein n=1 Tax=Ornithinimicrobium cerasi TaxID=2248773 RepID=A0A285VLY8_9MICO|nr:YlxR family protein [Ornithinimicrobium cerasi]SOC55079.1 hypothetical protein SAMN05421879_104143 [Ornithinimicrobium cerasi]